MNSKLTYYKNKIKHIRSKLKKSNESRIRRHQEMADYHDDMVQEGIHEEYHADKRDHHLEEIDKLREKGDNKPSKKDIGPISSFPNAGGQF